MFRVDYDMFRYELILIFVISFLNFGITHAEINPSPLVDGIDSVCPIGISGPLNVMNADPIPIVSSDDDANPSHAIIAVAASSGGGRVVALGHDGFFINTAINLYKNKKFGNNIVDWLEGTQGKKKILVTTGHGEPLVGSDAYNNFFTELTGRGYTINKFSGVLTPSTLSDVSILFISCPGPTLTNEEISVIKSFVYNGGGLFIQGLGWAWVQYQHIPLEDSPMNKIGAYYGFKWEDGYIGDTMHNFNGNPIFNIVYPDTRLYQLQAYLKIINAEGWNQAAVDASTSIFGTNGITSLKWEQFLTNFFNNNPFTNNLWGYIGYPTFYWIGDEAKRNLQNGMYKALLGNVERLTEENQVNLGEALNNDPMLLQSLINSHKFIHRISKEGQISDAVRVEIYNYYKLYINKYPGYFNSDVTFDADTYRFLGILRGQVYMNLKDLIPLTPGIKEDIAQVIKLNGRYLDIWRDFSVMILDNNGLDQDQRNFIYNYLCSIPKSLHDLGCISQYESLGNRWDNKDIGFEGSYINIVRNKIGSANGNPFPEDISAKNGDLFSSILSHELNHMVDGFSISKNPEKEARKNSLIDAAGVIRKNYLRSSRGPSPQYEDLCSCEGYGCDKTQSCEASVRNNCDLCFPIFASARGEFFASLANELFVDTAHTFYLAINRLEEGYNEPMNQFLFFAEIYSLGGDCTKFYTIGIDGKIQVNDIPLTRDSRDRIDSLIVGGNKYRFVLDDSGNVVSMSSTPVHDWDNLGGYVTSSPSVIVDNLGDTEAWVRGGDNALWVKIDGFWQSKGGVLASTPFAAKDYNGKIHVLARGSDNYVWDFIYDPIAATGHWKSLGGYTTEMATSAQDPTNHGIMRIAVKGGDNALWICDLDINTETYSWASLGGSLTTYPYIVFDTSGNEHILVRGFDSALWDKKGVVSGSSYTRTWCLLGGYLANAPIALVEPGVNSHIAVFVKGGDSALWMCDVNSAGEFELGTWYGLGGVITSDPFVVADTSANKIHAFVRGGDSALWMNTFSTNPWNPNGYLWQGIGGSILTYTPWACIGVNSQAFVLGTDHALWRSTHNTFSVDSSKLE
jgi:hypothetical protein